MATLEECRHAAAYYASLRGQENINWVEISTPYINRGNSQLYRLYIEVSYKYIYGSFSHGEKTQEQQNYSHGEKTLYPQENSHDEKKIATANLRLGNKEQE